MALLGAARRPRLCAWTGDGRDLRRARGGLTARFGPGVVRSCGGLLFAISTALLIGLPARPDYAGHFLPEMLIGGAGDGLILPTFTSAAVLAVPAERLTTGIAAETTFRQISAALAIAAWVAIYGSPRPAGILDAFDRGWTYMAACALVAAVTLLALAISTRTAGAQRSPAAKKPGPMTEREIHP